MNVDHEANQSYELSHYGLLSISGAGANKLLQGQISIDVTTLTHGQGSLAAHCNPQGRVISLFYIFNVNNDFYLAMPLDLLSIARQALQKYAPFYKANIDVTGNQPALLGINGQPCPKDALAAYTLPGTNCQICLVPALQEASLATPEAWEQLTIQSGIPSLCSATSSEFLPHDLNLPALDAISFTKGCFTGQEIIARMHYRGKPKNHLYRGTATEPLAPGTTLYQQDQPAGTVLTGSKISYNNAYDLLFVASESAVKNPLQTSDRQFVELQKSE